MKLSSRILHASVLGAVVVLAGPSGASLAPRQSEHKSAPSALVVDLGYATYQGYYESAAGLNIWRGVRYAAPPVGRLRWQAPQQPAESKGATIQANATPPICPQSGAAGTPAIYGFNSGPGDEDCLFLNVYSPPGAKNLPVLVYIHGGGYGLGSASSDPSVLMNTNGNGFVSVVIQYRLGAFGFLASEEVQQRGVVNAGLLDQRFALQWVQKHIAGFGGSPKQVTIAGESAGAGSVMFQALAYGGRRDEDLFENLIAASPYLPKQYGYADPAPSQTYRAFATAAGCGNVSPATHPTTFDCLVSADTAALQNASGKVSQSGPFGTFAFLPVTDGEFVQERPSVQLNEKKVNGKRILSGNNANDGVPLSPPTINTEEDFVNYLHTTFPLLTQADISRVLQVYPAANTPVDPSAPRFDTLGDVGLTALTVSEFGTGQQQRSFNLFAETTFDCPSYWLADAYTGDKQSWKYQYSVTPAYHGADLTAYFSQGAVSPSKAFMKAFQKIWGNFIMHNSPVISVADATGNAPNATVPRALYGDQIDWPVYTTQSPTQMNLNETGGAETTVVVTPLLSYKVRLEPGIVNTFRLVNARTWEGGRGARCDFWKSVAARVPQ